MPGGNGRYSKRISTHQPRSQYHQRSKSYGSSSYSKPNRPRPSRPSGPGFIESVFFGAPKRGKRGKR